MVWNGPLFPEIWISEKWWNFLPPEFCDHFDSIFFCFFCVPRLASFLGIQWTKLKIFQSIYSSIYVLNWNQKSRQYLKNCGMCSIRKLTLFCFSRFNGGAAAPPRKNCQTFSDFDPIPVGILMKTWGFWKWCIAVLQAKFHPIRSIFEASVTL